MRLALVGDSGVGKSNILSQFMNQKFTPTHIATIAAGFETKTIEVHGHKGEFQLWDTSGQPKFRALMPLYIRGAVGALVFYDVTSSASFASIGSWLEELRKAARPQVAIILVGNKADCEELRAVSFEEGKSFADREQLLFIETSAKDGTNISEAFEMVTAEAIVRYEKGAFD
jgi:small GTP-binding protein